MKLLIADDERIIRETISSLIDWKALGVELTGLCSNGLEAYDMILDESPDIVMTDIKMPGMSGLELIKKIAETRLDTQFIILSGYGEFEYAKEAMKYGVKHYILKPCNENQISESIAAVIADCHEKKREQMLKNGLPLLTNSLHYNIISGIITECATHNRSCEEMLQSYRAYIDFSSSAYQLFYVYYLEYGSLNLFLERLQEYYLAHMPQIALHGVYISNTLVLFFQSYAGEYGELHRFLSSVPLPDNPVALTIEGQLYPNLQRLLESLTQRLKRFSIIYMINHFRLVYTCNHNSFSEEALRLFRALIKGQASELAPLENLLEGTEDAGFLKQLANSLLLEGSLHSSQISPVEVTEWLIAINQESNADCIRELLRVDLDKILLSQQTQRPNLLVEQIYGYVEQHLRDSNITLKEIAENVLFMNVDYVSKRFLKETGSKFSDYLAAVRIRKAKQYLAEGCKIQDVAERIGCGNNPHYFSQLFKKKTGMTPSAYLAEIRGTV